MKNLVIALKSRISNCLIYIKNHRHLLPYAVKAIFNFKVDIISLKGQIRKADESITLLYVGRHANLPHLKKKYFADVTVVEIVKTNLLSFDRRMRDAEKTTDVTFLDIGWPYHRIINRRGEFLELPDWVNMIIPIDLTDWDDIVRQFRRTTRNNDLRLIRRNEYRCETSNDPEIVKNFYHDYYVPFTSHRFADELIFSSSLSEIENTVKDGGVILQVIGKNGPVAAGLVYPDDDALCFPFTGMPSAYLENPPEAAISAVNYFCIRYAFDHSLTSVDLMGTRAFPTDGILQFKRRWGAVLKDTFSPSSILFKLAENNSKAAVFSQHYPVIVRRNGGLELLVCSLDQEFDDASCKRILSSYYCDGIDQVTVVHVSELHKDTTLTTSKEHPHVRVVSCNLQSLAQHFARDFNPNEIQKRL